MAAVLRPPSERSDAAAVDELEALREAISAEKARIAETHRRWQLHQAVLLAADPVEARAERDAAYIQLLEKQNALLKARVSSLEDLNRNLAEEKARILQTAEPSRPLPQPTSSLLSAEVARFSEQYGAALSSTQTDVIRCRKMRQAEEQHLREIEAKDAELASLRTHVEELKLTLRTKEEDIVQLSQLKNEAASRARRGGDGELERTAEERRKAVEELITARATIERLQRDLSAAQEEARSASSDLRAVRASAEQSSVAARHADEALKEVAPADELSVAEKAAAAVQALRKARAEAQAEQSRRHEAERLLLEQRSEAEERLRAEAAAAERERQALAAQLSEAQERVGALVEQLAALAERRGAEDGDAEKKAAADESMIAEKAALEELLSDAQARVAELEAREALHADEVRAARDSQQKAQMALAEQLAAAEAALLDERAQVARLTAERERLWGEAATRKRSELPVVVSEHRGLDKEALFAQLHEVFYAEACARLLR